MATSPRPAVERALRFIGERLDQPLTAAEIARAAHLSEFHLHRVFHAEVGESIGRFVTRRRLELAALRLAYEPDRSITDIALSSGYSSSSNFSKAFRGYFGCSPTQVRAPGESLPTTVGTLTALHGKGFDPAELYTLGPAIDPEERARIAATWSERVRFEVVAARPLACLAGPGGYDLEALDQTWAELIPRARQLGLCGEDVDAWGIAHDSPQITAPERCRYHACVPCSEDAALPRPLTRDRVLAGRYAVFRYQGPVEGVGAAYRSLYSCWFPESSLAPADYRPLDHYVTDHPKDGQIELELWLRVRPQA